MIKQDLHGHTAFVSGSTSGIGAAIARELAMMGADVIVHGRDVDRAGQVAADIRSAGGAAHIAIGDLTDDAAAADVSARAAHMAGPIDILVNVTGSAGEGTWLSSDADVFLDQYELNTLSAVRLIHAMLPGMRARRWGRIVQISSIAAVRPLPDQVPAYCASKAALLAMTTSLAMTVAADGVNVNCITPGFILTPMLRSYFLSMPENAGKDWDELETGIAEMLGIRLGRLGRPEDIAGMVGYIVGPRGDWITGSNFRVDGGNLCSFT